MGHVRFTFSSTCGVDCANSSTESEPARQTDRHRLEKDRRQEDAKTHDSTDRHTRSRALIIRHICTLYVAYDTVAEMNRAVGHCGCGDHQVSRASSSSTFTNIHQSRSFIHFKLLTAARFP